MGINGGALTDYDPFLEAVGLLRASNVPPPYVVASNPRTLLALELLRRETGSNELGAPAGLPAFFTTSQLSVAESKGTASDASSAYVYAPAEVVVVRRQDSQIELDRSRLFDRDMSEMRAKMRGSDRSQPAGRRAYRRDHPRRVVAARRTPPRSVSTPPSKSRAGQAAAVGAGVGLPASGGSRPRIRRLGVRVPRVPGRRSAARRSAVPRCPGPRSTRDRFRAMRS